MGKLKVVVLYDRWEESDESGAAFELPLSESLSLSAGGSLRYFSKVSGIDNPSSGKEIDEGGTTRIDTNDALLGQVGVNVIIRFGGR